MDLWVEAISHKRMARCPVKRAWYSLGKFHQKVKRDAVHVKEDADVMDTFKLRALEIFP